MSNINHPSNQEYPKKWKWFSWKYIATLALTWSLLLSACSNNTSSWKDYEQQQRIENKIDKQEKKLNSTSRRIESLRQSRKQTAIRHNEKVAKYKHLKDNPNSKQKVANLEHSIIQLRHRVWELDWEIAKLKDKEYKLEWKLIDNNAKAAWLWASGDFDFIEVDPR